MPNLCDVLRMSENCEALVEQAKHSSGKNLQKKNVNIVGGACSMKAS